MLCNNNLHLHEGATTNKPYSSMAKSRCLNLEAYPLFTGGTVELLRLISCLVVAIFCGLARDLRPLVGGGVRGGLLPTGDWG